MVVRGGRAAESRIIVFDGSSHNSAVEWLVGCGCDASHIQTQHDVSLGDNPLKDYLAGRILVVAPFRNQVSYARFGSGLID